MHPGVVGERERPGWGWGGCCGRSLSSLERRQVPVRGEGRTWFPDEDDKTTPPPLPPPPQPVGRPLTRSCPFLAAPPRGCCWAGFPLRRENKPEACISQALGSRSVVAKLLENVCLWESIFIQVSATYKKVLGSLRTQPGPRHRRDILLGSPLGTRYFSRGKEGEGSEVLGQ